MKLFPCYFPEQQLALIFHYAKKVRGETAAHFIRESVLYYIAELERGEIIQKDERI